MADDNVSQGNTADAGSTDTSNDVADNADAAATAAAAAADDTSSTDSTASNADTSADDATGADADADSSDTETEKLDDAPAELTTDDYAKLDIPEGVFSSDDSQQRFTALLVEQQLAPETAQAVLAYAKGEADAQVKYAEDMKAEWAAEAEKDPEFGGEKFAENMARAVRTVDKLATPEFKELLNVSGLANHPDMVRVWLKVAEAVEDDTTITGGSSGNAVGSLSSRMFSSMPKK